jgi:iron complex transport system substrate-binding protein
VLTGCGAGEQAAAPTATTADTGYPRTVTDSTGAMVGIATRPQRVVALTNLWDLDAVLALGVAPVQFGIRAFVGQYTGSEQVSWPWHEEALRRLNATAERMNGDEPNLEVLALAKPDLIVGMPWHFENGREQFEQIAPTIALMANWRDSLRIVGDTFGQREQAEQIISATDARIATSLSDLNLGPKTVAIISCYDNITFNGFGHPADGRADLFQCAGFTLLDTIVAQATAEAPVAEFSIELLPSLAPADVIVLFDYGDGTTGSGILANPLFTQLPAVKDGRLVVLTQGELAQGLSTISPVNVEFCLKVVRQAGELVA